MPSSFFFKFHWSCFIANLAAFIPFLKRFNDFRFTKWNIGCCAKLHHVNDRPSAVRSAPDCRCGEPGYHFLLMPFKYIFCNNFCLSPHLPVVIILIALDGFRREDERICRPRAGGKTRIYWERIHPPPLSEGPLWVAFKGGDHLRECVS